jgi:ABC-type branched-subunit amino acid transport system substrate-binding protein
MSTCAGTSLFGPAALGDHAFTAGTPTEIEAAAMAEWAYKEGGFRQVGMIVDGAIAFNPIYASAFKEVFTGLGGTVGVELSFKAGDASVADQVARIASTDGIDAVVAVTLMPDGPNVVKQLRSGGVDQPILAHSGMSGTDWVSTVPNLGDLYFTDMVALQGADPRAEVLQATESYTEVHGAPPAGITFTGYILGQIIGQALEGTGGDPSGAAMVTWLEGSEISTIVGGLKFTGEDHIDRERAQVILKHADGGGVPEVQSLVEPETVPRSE